jgi:hypothetical protein
MRERKDYHVPRIFSAFTDLLFDVIMAFMHRLKKIKRKKKYQT